MKGLILDTSSNTPYALLTSEGSLLASCFTFNGKTSTTFLADVEKFLMDQQTSFKEICYIGVGKGPGSFSGTRVAVILASSLCYAMQIPLMEFCSLSAFAIPELGEFACLADAKSKGFYALFGSKTFDQLHFLSPQLLSIEEALIVKKIPLYCLNKQDLITKEPSLSLCLQPTSIDTQRLAKELYDKLQSKTKTPATIPSVDIDYLRIS